MTMRRLRMQHHATVRMAKRRQIADLERRVRELEAMVIEAPGAVARRADWIN